MRRVCLALVCGQCTSRSCDADEPDEVGVSLLQLGRRPTASRMADIEAERVFDPTSGKEVSVGAIEPEQPGPEPARVEPDSSVDAVALLADADAEAGAPVDTDQELDAALLKEEAQGPAVSAVTPDARPHSELAALALALVAPANATDDPQREEVAKAYLALDAAFRDYLGTHYPLEDLDRVDGTYVSHLLGDSDIVGDALAPAHEHPHQGQSALLFLCVGLILGIATLHGISRLIPTVPYTSVLFLEGCLLGSAGAAGYLWQPLAKSITVWENIDPHLLFYAFLPVLVFGDAMSLNIHLFARCLPQVLVLAVPGVVFNTLATATFVVYVLPYDFNWPTSIALGAILSATDPVAVVALFKALGVSPRLTMLISGESLLNDGTAIVLFALFNKIILGAHVTQASVMEFLGLMMALAPILGMIFGFVAVAWIGMVRRKYSEGDSLCQVVLTIACAYSSFFFAESMFCTSGVLTTVTAGCVLASVGIPRLNDVEMTHHVWHVIEYIANTLIFLLAGLIVGRIIVERHDIIRPVDYWWLLALYFALVLLRGVGLVVLWPLMRLVGPPITWQEVCVLTWSGLRGAVGLALAIMMDIEPRIDHETGTRVMFMVGGIAAMTLIVNGTTTRYLLAYLEIGLTSRLKEEMLLTLKHRLDMHVDTALVELTDATKVSKRSRFYGADLSAVKEALAGEEDEDSGLDALELVGNAPLDARRLLFLREIFLHMVRNAYDEGVEEGAISGTSSIVQTLMHSVDQTLDEVHVELHDWALLHEQLTLRPAFHTVATFVLEIWPFDFWRAELKEHTARGGPEMMAVAVLSFIDAHDSALNRLVSYFGATGAGQCPEEKTIVAESTAEMMEAEKVLARLPEELVTLTRSKMLAARLTETEADSIQRMFKLGVLTDKEAASMLERVGEKKCKASRIITEYQRSEHLSPSKY